MKRYVSLMLVAFMLATFPMQVFADNMSEQLVVELDYLVFTSEYTSDVAYVSYEREGDVYIGYVKSLETDDILETYKESPCEDNSENQRSSAVQSRDYELTYKPFNSLPPVMTVMFIARVYHESISGQANEYFIDRVSLTQYLSTSSGFSLGDYQGDTPVQSVFSTDMRKCTIYSFGVLEAPISLSGNLSLGIPDLGQLQFELIGGVIYRKSFSKQFVLSLPHVD